MGTSPQFQEPEFVSPRRPGRYHYSPEKLAKRYQRLAQIDRQCAYKITADRLCYANAATVEVSYYDKDPATGKPSGPLQRVRACARHKIVWQKGGTYIHVATTRLPERG